MKFKLEIDMSGSAFEGDPHPELCRILRVVMSRAHENIKVGSGTVLVDIDGNRCGMWRVS